MREVLVLQNAGCETLGIIAGALDAAGVAPRYVRAFDGEPIPRAVGDAAGLIVMGGPMGVYDHPRYPFLLDEMRLIEQALRADRPALGVCLGSQLIASVLGTAVTGGRRKEIGWHAVTLAEPAETDPLWAGIERSFVAYHWHGDIFDLPSGATSLASSEATTCQAFRYGSSVYGLLFHLEVTPEIIEGMVRAFAGELEEEGLDGRAILGDARRHLPSLHRIGEKVFRGWAGLAAAKHTRGTRDMHGGATCDL